ncbi:GNAT family N-acetyltransferase [Clostridium chauvoei]|uniref:GNAT family N-acetyltransferase n=3 Tax=Clostridium chauvoei TaxID=46867 RepID=A0ABD4RKP7_9CLOT|nr:GNAT family N-acetyltransferase [Clostridium chauvoei]ATD53788.1 GNAT family N-acetyltransferase [Clostridium chauvoei]ATD58404.1 GNAT family N-acetyltransferase [Clostridium chauvoei]MBX7281742.1 GNAT family N-acetyltransferase [Clostridium chauvoei]MBX7284285.1 GNAT family N-acetyltransferase [Clostridium chauvoei]MBX7286780.1 GNAT family N-acetyltransferase [Clostridium chauvoei]
MKINNNRVEYKISSFYDLTRDDIYEIAKCRYEVFACEQKIVCENDFDDKDKDCYHLLAYYEEKLIGYCRILKSGMGYEKPSIGRVLVLKEYRRNSIAQEMMQKAIEFIKENFNDDEIILSAQLYVQNLYNSIGFKQISNVYDEAEIPHIKMSFKIK